MENFGNKDRFEPPNIGLKLRLNHEFELQSKHQIFPRFKQFLNIFSLLWRLVKYCIVKRFYNRRPIVDCFDIKAAQRIYGCPIGGIGGGTIGRGFKGEFCRFQLNPGLYEYVTVPECQFIVNIQNGKHETIFQSVLSTYNKPKTAPQTWEWNLNGSECEYTALYPRAWTTYDLSKYGVKLICRQISPVIPHNYQDSSLPCAVFVFSAINTGSEHRDVNVAFTWTRILTGKCKNKTKGKVGLQEYSEELTCGVTLKQTVGEVPCTFTLAKRKRDSETIHDSYCLWNSLNTSSYVWECLNKNGKLQPDSTHTPPLVSDDSIALSSTMSLDPGGCDSTEFCLAWDMPVVKYKKDKKIHKRYYTIYFGSDGLAGPKIAGYALRNYKYWEKKLDEWQSPILTNSNIPDWLKCALMNELYFVADGGTIWFDVHDEFPETDPRYKFGVFGYLEGHQYIMYNTYDVHFYASFALAQLWPNLQVVLQYMFRDSIEMEVPRLRETFHNGNMDKIKEKNSIPHDLGSPDGIPFTHINAYLLNDVSKWRDLNLKFILQVMRDYHMLLECRETTGAIDKTRLQVVFEGDEGWDLSGTVREWSAVWGARRYLGDMYPACAALLRRGTHFDADNDGLIENSGAPDQTYDMWVMTGPSAYCGGLWVASISVVAAMARILGFEEDEREFNKMLEVARISFEEKLWNGSFYRFDTKLSNSNVVMADQLAGQWYLRSSGWTNSVFPEVNVKKALQCIYENNVMRFKGGTMGAVNGYLAGDRIDISTIQSEEVWPGVTYGLGALMIHEGMHEQAFVTAGGLYGTLMKMGLAFETPEALYENGNHRSVAYMRPLAVWAMYQAITARPLH